MSIPSHGVRSRDVLLYLKYAGFPKHDGAIIFTLGKLWSVKLFIIRENINISLQNTTDEIVGTVLKFCKIQP